MNTNYGRIRVLTYHGEQGKFENLFAYGRSDVDDIKKHFTKMKFEDH